MSNKKRIQKKRKSIEQKIFLKKYNVRFSDVYKYGQEALKHNNFEYLKIEPIDFNISKELNFFIDLAKITENSILELNKVNDKVNKEYINQTFKEAWDSWVENPRTERRYEVKIL